MSDIHHGKAFMWDGQSKFRDRKETLLPHTCSTVTCCRGPVQNCGMLGGQVTEQYSTVRETSMARRDLRSGQQTARASFKSSGVLKVDITWGTPYACELSPPLL